MGEPGTLKPRIAEETKTALKAGERVRLGTLRMLSAAIKNREVELRRELTDDEVVEVAIKESKQRTEAVQAYEQAGREDLAAKERDERDVLAEYVPAGLSEEETTALVDEAIAATGATTMSDMGKVMGFVMGRAKGRVDGAKVQALVRARLGG